jgi:hypothetical protein
MVAAIKAAVCCDDLLHFALSKPALQPEVRAVGEWEDEIAKRAKKEGK